jgi:hypothetical protein
MPGSTITTDWSGNLASVDFFGNQRVTQIPLQTFYNAFDTGLDTVVSFTSISGGGGVAASNNVGFTKVGTGTTANGYSVLTSQPTFQPRSPGWIYADVTIVLPPVFIANAYHGFGLMNPQATPTVANPYSNAVVFELTTAGLLQCAVYASGSRTLVADVTSIVLAKLKQVAVWQGVAPPTSLAGLTIPGGIYFRGDRILFAVGDPYQFSPDSNPIMGLASNGVVGFPEVIVAQTMGGPGPDNNTMSIGISAIAGAIAPASNSQLTCPAMVVSENDRVATQVCDPVYAWRKQRIAGTGEAYVNPEGLRATYRYCVNGVTPVATPTDFIQIQGSATKTVRIKRIKVGGVATGTGNMPCNMIRRSTIGTQGSATVTAIVAGKHDTSDPAPTAAVGYVQTANWTTPGTSAGLLGADRIPFAVSGTGANPQEIIWDQSIRGDKAIVLRGVSDWLYVNLAGAAVPAGGVIDIEIETEEDNS